MELRNDLFRSSCSRFKSSLDLPNYVVISRCRIVQVKRILSSGRVWNELYSTE